MVRARLTCSSGGAVLAERSPPIRAGLRLIFGRGLFILQQLRPRIPAIQGDVMDVRLHLTGPARPGPARSSAVQPARASGKAAASSAGALGPDRRYAGLAYRSGLTCGSLGLLMPSRRSSGPPRRFCDLPAGDDPSRDAAGRRMQIKHGWRHAQWSMIHALRAQRVLQTDDGHQMTAVVRPPARTVRMATTGRGKESFKKVLYKRSATAYLVGVSSREGEMAKSSLAKVITALQREVGIMDDPMNDVTGICPLPLLDRVAQKHGWESSAQVNEEAARVCTPKWAWDNVPTQCWFE